MKIAMMCLLLWAPAAVWAADAPLYVTAAQWAQPRSGAMVSRLPALATAMHRLKAGQRLQLYYPGGDEGSLWANELRAWLVALGLSSRRIELLPGSSREDAIEVRVAGTATTTAPAGK